MALLVSTSFVLIVQNNNPLMFSIDYLRDKEIVPSASVTQSITLPPLSQIGFANGLIFEAVDQRIKVEMKFSDAPEFDLADPQVPDDGLEAMASKLAKEVSFMHLESVGVNFQVVLEGKELDALTRGLPDDAEVNDLSFSRMTEPFRQNVSLAKAVHQETGTNGVLLTANFDGQVHNKSSTTSRRDELLDKIRRRSECIAHLGETINATRF